MTMPPAKRSWKSTIDVRGKVGTGYAKSMNGAVHPYERLKARRRNELESLYPEETSEKIDKRLKNKRLFRPFDRDMFNKILDEEGLKFDRDGQRRTAYSLHHTYISTRLMEGASIHMIANNCRTSVQMIEEHYAAHIKDRLDASMLNVMRPQRQRKASRRNKPGNPEISPPI